MTLSLHSHRPSSHPRASPPCLYCIVLPGFAPGPVTWELHQCFQPCKLPSSLQLHFLSIKPELDISWHEARTSLCTTQCSLFEGRRTSHLVFCFLHIRPEYPTGLSSALDLSFSSLDIALFPPYLLCASVS